MVGGNNPGQYNDTTFTKIFVGGLAWETQRDTMRRYFEQFGEILEAVVITDKNTGRSKGYGFVTFKDPDAAMRACQNPSPIIDGRRANCNLASLGAQKTRPPTHQHGVGRFRSAPGLIAAPGYHGSSTYIQQPTDQYFIPYSAYGYTGYSQDSVYPLNYYNLYGGQQFSPYYTRMLHNVYPFYPQMVPYASLPQQVTGVVSLPSSMPMAATTAATTAGITATTTSTAPAVVETTTVATTKIEPPITTPLPQTATTTDVGGKVPGPSQVSETPTERKPPS
ncbi:RNA-binding protein 38 [Hibiscus syriacus]|uniref:RNA-binding protein 38 n=2 Tax=Hibiscus syriacus TaxID=106335 RepID=A0A6A2YD11_HIBSY|nr:RNA-binding protein 38 [Hibiscus syriacus]